MTTQRNEQEVTEYTDMELAGVMDRLGDLDTEVSRLDTEAEAATEEVIAAEEIAEQDVPEEVAASETGAAPAPMDFQVIQEENVRLRNEQQEYKQRDRQRDEERQENRIQEAAYVLAQQQMSAYIEQGWDETQARQMAILEARTAVAEHRASIIQLDADRTEVSRVYGVPKGQLTGFKNKEDMHNFGVQYQQTTGPQARKVQELEKKVEFLSKRQVPAQNYNQASPARGSTTDQQDMDRYIGGARDEKAIAAGRRAAGRG